MLRNLIDKLKGKIPDGTKRSGQWPTVRKFHLLHNPNCAVCGGTKKVEVHHIEPFHIDPSKELSLTNLITLCEGNPSVNCHLTFGHLGNFKLSNPEIVSDAADWLKKFREARVKPQAEVKEPKAA